MLSLTRKTDYALVALARLAQQRADGGAALSARCIADEYGLPRQLLMSLLKSLHRAGLVESTRGLRGGYELARAADRITIADVVEAIEGSARLTPCCSDEPPGEACTMCSLVERCPVTGAIRDLNGQIADFLRGVTVDTLLEKAKTKTRAGRAVALSVKR